MHCAHSRPCAFYALCTQYELYPTGTLHTVGAVPYLHALCIDNTLYLTYTVGIVPIGTVHTVGTKPFMHCAHSAFYALCTQ